jgi:hypothetical protein
MASQMEIQQLVNQAQTKINLQDFNGAKQLWPMIRTAIGEYDGLPRSADRMRLANLIFSRLDNLGLQFETKPINIAEVEEIIRKDPQAGKEDKSKISWLPF